MIFPFVRPRNCLDFCRRVDQSAVAAYHTQRRQQQVGLGILEGRRSVGVRVRSDGAYSSYFMRPVVPCAAP